MNIRYKLFYILSALALIVFVGGCNMPSKMAAPTMDPGLIHTAAAQTVQAQLTMAAAGTAIVMPSLTPAVLQPGATATNTPTEYVPPAPLATNTPVPPTNIPVPPSATPILIPCDRASFVEDVTFPDNAEVAAGVTFVKIWRLKNNGSCTWNSSYSIVFENGDSMGAPASLQLTTNTVAPGQTIDVAVSLTAPNSAKTYQGFWKLRNGAGITFGIGEDAKSSFWAKVKVINPTTATPTATATNVATLAYDFIAQGPNAEWHNGSALISWGDPDDDSKGVAVDLKDTKLENGKVYAKGLATYPQFVDNGLVYGIFPSYTIQNGDRFRAYLGLKTDCSGGKVRYQLKYREGSNDTQVAEWLKACDGTVLSIDKDLSSLAGKTVQFILYVSAEGSYKDDHAVWAHVRIER